MELDNNTYQISDAVLKLLSRELPDAIIKKLTIIRNIEVHGISDFEYEMKTILGEDYDQYKEKILNASELIESDNDTQDADLYERENGQGSIYPYDPTKADIDIRDEPQTVYELVVRKWIERELVVMPDFQRNFVWKPTQQSQFIESVLLGFPLPPFYINKHVSGKYLVVDGRQRLTTLRRFLEDKFALSELRAFPELNGKKYSDLKKINSDFQTKIEDNKLLVYLIQPSVPLEMVYDMFNRINTGGTQLERQEIRNCIYLGKATKLLKKLANENYFKQAISEGISSNRAKDQESVLRVISFMILDYKIDYKGSMNDFVEKAMQMINARLSDAEIDKYEQQFKTAMETTTEIFGSWANFRIPTNNTRGRVNIAILESVANFFKETPLNSISEEDKIEYKKKYKILLQNSKYYDAVRFSTGSTKKVRDRFELVKEIFSQEYNDK